MAGIEVTIAGLELEVSLETPVIEIELSCYPGFTLPPGGETDDILVKLSDANGHVGWMSRANFFKSYFDDLPSYTDDAAAVADGRALNDLYWVATGSDSNIPGTLRRVTTV